jgi:hypothetical protein
MQTESVQSISEPRQKSIEALKVDRRKYERERAIGKRPFQEAVREIVAKAKGKREIFPRLAGRFDIDEETWSAYLALPEDK